MFIVSVLFVGFSIVNVVILVSPGDNLPPNQLVCGMFFIGIANSSKPIAVELILVIDSLRIVSMFDDVIELCTTNVPP